MWLQSSASYCLHYWLFSTTTFMSSWLLHLDMRWSLRKLWEMFIQVIKLRHSFSKTNFPLLVPRASASCRAAMDSSWAPKMKPGWLMCPPHPLTGVPALETKSRFWTGVGPDSLLVAGQPIAWQQLVEKGCPWRPSQQQLLFHPRPYEVWVSLSQGSPYQRTGCEVVGDPSALLMPSLGHGCFRSGDLERARSSGRGKQTPTLSNITLCPCPRGFPCQ